MFQHASDKKCLYSFILFEEMQKQYLKNIYVIFEEMFARLLMICSYPCCSFKEKEIRGKAIISLQFLLESTNVMKSIEPSQLKNFGLNIFQTQNFSDPKLCWTQLFFYTIFLDTTFFSCISSSLTYSVTEGLRDSRTNTQLCKVFYGHVWSCIDLYGLVIRDR